MNVELAILPVLVTAVLLTIGGLVKWAVGQVVNRIDNIDSAMAKVSGQLSKQASALDERLDQVDRRLTRIESWKELVTLPRGPAQ